MSVDLVGYTFCSMLRRLGPAALVVCVLASCSNPPTKEHDQAQAALAAARAAGAATFAADELVAAQTALDKYDQAVQQGDYRQALSDAIDARDRAYEAARQATAQKAAARAQLQAAITQAEGLIKAAGGRLAPGAMPHLAAAAADRLRAASRAASSALQEARTELEAQQWREGLAKLQPTIDELQKALAPADGPRRGRGPK
jgi:hypothetical protein